MTTITKPTLLEDLGTYFPTATSKQKKRFALYKCQCGTEFKTQIANVKRGLTQSCGCYHVQRVTTHSVSKHPLYVIWNQMVQRTTNFNHKQYKDWGGRGISVCDRWLDINNFIEDMSPTYINGLSIDRIDNNKGYSPDNCRWTTRAIQARNTRKLMSTNTSGYRGVSWDKEIQKWAAKIRINSKHKKLGRFNTPLEAARAYDNFVITHNLEHTQNFEGQTI